MGDMNSPKVYIIWSIGLFVVGEAELHFRGEHGTRYGADAASACGIEGMELRCRVYKFIIPGLNSAT